MEENTLRTLQLTSLEILLEFRRVCERLGLRYYLTAGTLLGAVRHGGFIPWDDDIDVVMPREDYDRLARLAPQMLSAGYVYQSSQTEPSFPCYFAKIRKKGTYASEPLMRSIPIEQGIYIDIFPLDVCPDREWSAAFFFKGMELLYCAIMGRVCREFVCGYRKRYMRALWRVLTALPTRWLHGLREGLRRIVTRTSSGRRLCTVGGSHGYPRESYEAEWFQESVPIAFEGHRFSAPSGWEQLLENMYGEYMSPPPEEERQGHFIE